jgi:ribonuclease HI
MRKIECNFDGACAFPGGKMGSGFVIFENDKFISEGWDHFPAEEINTSNVAEYYGVLTLFERLIELGLENEEIFMRGDSDLVIKQMSNQWDIKRGNYIQYAFLAKEIMPRFKTMHWEWIPREENSYADKLSKKGLNNEPKK